MPGQAPPERIRRMPLPVDTDRFRPDVAPLPLPGAGTFRFLATLDLQSRKGWDALGTGRSGVTALYAMDIAGGVEWLRPLMPPADAAAATTGPSRRSTATKTTSPSNMV